MRRAVLILSILLTAGCAAGSGSAPGPTPTPTPTPTPLPGCHGTPAAADRTRYAVVSHPYDASSNPSPAWEVLALSTAGAISHVADFTLGRATNGRVAFTPDGELGVAALEDGSLGVFRLGTDGTPAAVTTSFHGAFYASAVTISPTGDRAIVIDPDTTANGGGLYEVDLACDGTPTDAGLLTAARTPGAIRFLDPTHAIAAALELPQTAAGDDAALLDFGSATPAALDGADAFGDDSAIVPDLAVTADGKYVLIPDDNTFQSGGRIAVVEIGASSLAPRQLLGTVADPPSIVASPFAGGGALVLSADQGNTAWWLKEDAANASAPFTLDSQVSWTTGPAPQLPLVAVTVDRGALEGRVLIAENLGIRQVAFPAGGGKPTDLGLHSFGSGVQHITGALGLQP